MNTKLVFLGMMAAWVGSLAEAGCKILPATPKEFGYQGVTREFKVQAARGFSFDSPQEADCAKRTKNVSCLSLSAATESKTFPANDTVRPKFWSLRAAVKNMRGRRAVCALNLTQAGIPPIGASDRKDRNNYQSQSVDLSRVQDKVQTMCDKHSLLGTRINGRITRSNQELPRLNQELESLLGQLALRRTARTALARDISFLNGELKQLDKDIKNAIPNTSQLESEIAQLDRELAGLVAQKDQLENEYNSTSYWTAAKYAYLMSANSKNGEGLNSDEREVWDRQIAFLSQQDNLRSQTEEKEGEKSGKQDSLSEIQATGTLNKENLQRQKQEKEALKSTKIRQQAALQRLITRKLDEVKSKRAAIERYNSVGQELVAIHPFCSLLNPPAPEENTDG